MDPVVCNNPLPFGLPAAVRVKTGPISKGKGEDQDEETFEIAVPSCFWYIKQSLAK